MMKKVLVNVVLGGSMVAGMMVVSAACKYAIKRYKTRSDELEEIEIDDLA